MNIDARSRKNIATLLPAVRPWAEEFLRRAKAEAAKTGHDVQIISGNRSYAEQNDLYAKGRTKPGNVVTNARGGFSNHNFGVAWDIGIFKGKFYNPADGKHLYAKIGKIGRDMGLEWGGDWRSFPDMPHFQIDTGYTLRELRDFVSRGKPIPIPRLENKTDAARPIDILIDGEKLNPTGLLISGKTWVPVRAFGNMAGGSVVAGLSGEVDVIINDQQATFRFRNVGGTGYVPFTELNRLYGFEYTFGGDTLRLTS